MAEQEGYISPALLVLHLHLPHLLHPEGDRGSKRVVHGVQERRRSSISGFAADPTVRGQVLHQNAVL